MDITRTLLEWLIANGPMTLGLVAFICALGVPLPIPVLMIAAGALVRQGQMQLPAAVAVTVGGSLIAETLFYAIGHELGPLARTKAGARFASVYDEAERRFMAHPGLSVYLTRWLFAPLGVPTSLIAGASRFSLPRFVFSAVVGNAMWIAGYTAIGYALGNDWHNVSPVFDRYKVYFAVAAVALGLLYFGWRKRQLLLPATRAAVDAATPKKPVTKPAPVEDPHNPPKR